mmetsp:Transcript_25432/g.36442  ORF Transcript_25432/g.36442 Transcript_25432/m.36442 type:complete len:89 (+) Transcript_25432:265-531(+)
MELSSIRYDGVLKNKAQHIINMLHRPTVISQEEKQARRRNPIFVPMDKSSSVFSVRQRGESMSTSLPRLIAADDDGFRDVSSRWRRGC